MTDRYAVIGNPIAHSKSPAIHHAFAEQLDQDLVYTAELIPLDGLKEGLTKLQSQGFKGINVTVPFKEQVWQQLENKSDQATLAGAINTVIFNDDGSSYGDNTDGIGLCRDLIDNHNIQLSDHRILLLGAGGAARGVILPLLKHQPSELVIANRTVSKAQNLADLFSEFGNIQASGFENISGQFDVIINATSASIQGQVPPIPSTVAQPTTCCYDMMYGASDTAFIQWAKAHKVSQAIDGLGMLVEQAAEAFYLWRGLRPNTQSVIASLR